MQSSQSSTVISTTNKVPSPLNELHGNGHSHSEQQQSQSQTAGNKTMKEYIIEALLFPYSCFFEFLMLLVRIAFSSSCSLK